jgi:hypothetical protein
MSIERMTQALNLVDKRLTPTDKLVLIGIANHDGDGGAWPSIITLARYANVQPRRVRAVVAHLEELGYVTREVNAGGLRDTPADRRPNLYRLHLDTGGSVEPPAGGPGEPPAGGSVEPPNRPREPSKSKNPPTPPLFDAPGDPPVALRAEFDELWKLYPRMRRHGIDKTFDVFKRQRVTVEFLAILRGLQRWREEWEQRGDQYAPAMDRWLRERRWESAPEPRVNGLRVVRDCNGVQRFA